MKPFLERCIVKVDKKYIKDENGKPELNDIGEPTYEAVQEATVTKSNIEGVKKGMKVVPLLRGGVPIIKEETKKYTIVVLDKEEIYAIE